MENKEDGCIICFDEKKVIHAKCHVCTGIIIHRKCLDIIIFKYGGKCPKCRGKLVKEVSVIGKNIMFPNSEIPKCQICKVCIFPLCCVACVCV